MTVLALLLPILAAGGFQQIPLDADDTAQVFVAPVTAEGERAVFVASMETVTIYRPPHYTSPHRVALPANANYIDVADLDGDGQSELIVVAAGDVYTTTLSTTAPLRANLQLPSHAPSISRGPVPTYIAHRVGERVILRVPTRDGYQQVPWVATPENAQREDADRSDEDISEVNAGTEAGGLDVNAGVDLFPVTPPQAAPPGGAEYVARPLSDVAGPVPGNRAEYQRSGTVGQARDAADQPPEYWPWFNLGGTTEAGRALYALDPPDYDRTLIRIAQPNATPMLGPPRLYPGAIVPPRDKPPDFNGDGWADLLLWRAPIPTFSLSSLTRWAQTGRWSLDLMPHLFDPETMRFNARPAAVLRTQVPLVGFLEPTGGLPVSLWAVGDFDGDSQDDLLLKSDPRRLDVWLYRDEFAAKPDAALRFSDPVTDLEFAGPLEPGGATILVVRTQNQRHLAWFEED